MKRKKKKRREEEEEGAGGRENIKYIVVPFSVCFPVPFVID
jgi:hypothetical protein